MLKEFTWEAREGEKHSLDCRILVDADGQYEVQNLQEPSQSVKFASIEDLIASFEEMLHTRSSSS